MSHGHKIAEMTGMSALTTNENSLNNILNKIQDSSVTSKIKHSEAGEMAQCLRELSTLVEGPGLVPKRARHSQPLPTPVPEDWSSSSGLQHQNACGAQTQMCI